MLPILRIIPVGGVSLAIMILVLALNPPGGLRPPLTRAMMPAHGALIARSDHPEWRQWLIIAALRRADALSQLRQLADIPVRSENKPDKAKTENPQKAPEVAGVPANRSDADPEDVTGTVAQSPDAAIPVDIGETSSFELPVIPHEQKPPVILTPERSRPPHESLNVAPEPAKPARESQKRTMRHTRHARMAAKSAEPVQFNLLEALFGSFSVDQRTAKPGR
jgi:hypothetical protein